MARIFTQPERLYQVGTYGPFRVDSLTREDTNGLLATMTAVNWPEPVNGQPLATVTLQWELEGGQGAQPPVQTWGIGKPRPPRTSVTMALGLPDTLEMYDAEGNLRPVTGGRITVVVNVPLRSAVRLEPTFHQLARAGGGDGSAVA